MSYYDDVAAFHEKFGFDTQASGMSCPLSPDIFAYRFRFLLEELAELAEARGATLWAEWLRVVMGSCRPDDVPEAGGDLAGQADALVDLAYVCLGSAHFMHLDFNAHWNEVQRANMAKERGPTKRGHALDVMKPEGWIGPQHEAILLGL